MPKVGTAYVSIRAKLDKLDRDLQKGQQLTEKRAKATQQAVSRAFRGIVAYFGVQQINRFTQSIFLAGRQIARLDKAYAEISGSTALANKEFDFLRKTSDELGQNFYDLADAYKGLFAASKGTAIQGKVVQDIFYGLVRASATLGLSSEDVKLSIYAVQQMMSKGRVASEELRRQLGERLPGAFNLAAEAMGVSTAELDRMLKAGEVLAADMLPKLSKLLQSRYSGAVDDATRASNELAEAWMDAKATMADSGFLVTIAKSMQDLATTLKDPGVQQGLETLARGLGRAVGFMTDLVRSAAGWAAVGQGQLGFFEFATMNAEELSMWLQQNTGELAEINRRIDELKEKARKESKLPSSFLGFTTSAMKARDERIKSLNAEIALLKERKALIIASQSAISGEGIDLSEINRTNEAAAMEYTKKELAAFSKGADDYVDLWRYAANEKYEILSRVLDEEIRIQEQANEHSRLLADARVGDYVDSWQIQMKDASDVHSRSLNLMVKDQDSFSEDMKTAISGWASNFSGQLTDALFDSQATFDGILESFVKMLAQMVIQKRIVEPLLKFAFGETSATVEHAGGPAGYGPKRTVPSHVFWNAPRLHNGLASDEFPVILQKGETVIPKGGAKGVGVTVNVINNNGSKIRTQERDTPNGPQLDVIIDNAVADKAVQRGTALNRALRNTYGTQQPLTVR